MTIFEYLELNENKEPFYGGKCLSNKEAFTAAYVLWFRLNIQSFSSGVFFSFFPKNLGVNFKEIAESKTIDNLKH